VTATDVLTERRRRAAELLEVYPHAAEMLALYLALIDAWQPALERLAAQDPPAELAATAVRVMLPGALEATIAAAPKPLSDAVLRRFYEADLEGLVQRWLDGADLSSVDRYLARVCASPLLEAFPSLLPGPAAPAPDERCCPACGGLPQLSYFGISGEALVAAPRRLLCSRCAHSWVYPRLVCAGCGSEDTARLPIYSDSELFAGLRIDACEACSRYLVTVDLPKEPTAVPIVDELAALPLDLFARERGFQKITPNLMGF
jgi:FdhE protein